MRTPLKIAVLAAIVGAAGVAATVHWRGHVRCYLLYPECSPFIQVPEEKPWDIPTNPVEKAAYDYSHALPLPPGMPQPVPFDFRAARLKEGYGGKSVGQQYFEHLCATEDVEVIVQPAKDVRGFHLMRPRANSEASPLNTDRYAPEEVTGMGWLSDDDQLDRDASGIGGSYIQPLYGLYEYVEYEMPDAEHQYFRVERSDQGDLTRYPYGVEANWRPASGLVLRMPYLHHQIAVAQLQSKYAYTWRGIRRTRDREFGIGGGEYLIVDKEYKTVLGIKRTFNSTFIPKKPNWTNWYAARECVKPHRAVPIPKFIIKVLKPDINVNDTYLGSEFLDQYHKYLQVQMEKNYEQ